MTSPQPLFIGSAAKPRLRDSLVIPHSGFLICLFLLFAASASAQWVNESYPLKAGYNAVWLSIDCSDRDIIDVVPASVDEIWQWNADTSSAQFDEQPLVANQADSQWHVWKRNGAPVETTLGLLTANAAYIVKVADGTPAFNMVLRGKPAAPDYLLKSSGVNFFGFPTRSATNPQNFTNFLSFSEVLKNAPQIFYYDGEASATSKRLVTPNSKTVTRGHAYWINSTTYTDYYGPLKVTVQGSGGIDFGDTRNTVSLRVKNVVDPARTPAVNVTATLTLVDSAPPPLPAAQTVPPDVKLLVRGPRDNNLEYTYTELELGTYQVTLAPGEEREIVLDANRSTLTTPGGVYASVLQVTDSLNHNRIDLPVSAVGTSRQGVWVGAAVLNAVNQVETLSGPEYDAPEGIPDGETLETVTVTTTTQTTVGGTVTSDHVEDVTFEADGGAYLSAPGATVTSVVPRNLVAETDAGFNPGTDGAVACFATQPDGKILVGGVYFATLAGQSRMSIGRLNADGTLDTAFNPPGGANDPIQALAVQADGKIVVGGRFTTLGGVSRNRIGRLNADGTLDTSFDPPGGADGIVWALVVQPDGKIVVGGNFTTLGGVATSYLQRLNADGTPDASFNGPGGGTGLCGRSCCNPMASWSLAVPFLPLGHTNGVMLPASMRMERWTPVSIQARMPLAIR